MTLDRKTIAIARMRLPILLLSLCLLQACATSAARIDAVAQRAGLTRTVVAGSGFRHVVYANLPATQARSQPLVIFLEGDGRPWTRDGLNPTDDPTGDEPFALELMIRTAQPALYVSRPCYQLRDPQCEARLWTSARYSEEIVASMTAAILALADDRAAPAVTLVGYSGGGVLAVLIAEHLDRVREVITIGANLDIDAWTQARGFLPLAESLNPARSQRRHLWPEVHYHGGHDRIVPPDTRDDYFVRYPQARREVIGDYDHTCCWLESWPSLLDRARESQPGE